MGEPQKHKARVRALFGIACLAWLEESGGGCCFGMGAAKGLSGRLL
jgi:hypothetical protein